MQSRVVKSETNEARAAQFAEPSAQQAVLPASHKMQKFIMYRVNDARFLAFF